MGVLFRAGLEVIFANENFIELHDTLAEINDRDYSTEECRAAFFRLPQDIQAQAMTWGLSDSVFRDSAYVFLRDNKEQIEICRQSK